MCDTVESNGWLYFKDDVEIDPDSFFVDYATDMGLGANDEMVIVKEWEDEGLKHIRFKQFHQSIPVSGGVYTLHLKDCHVMLAHGKIVEQLDVALPATISDSTALQTALTAIGATTYAWQDTTWENELKEEENDTSATYYPIGKLLIFGEAGTPMIDTNFRLAYKFDVLAINPYSFQEVYIDAHTGEVIKNSGKGLYADGTCTTLFNGSRDIQTHHRWLQDDYILRDNSRGTYIWTKYYENSSNPWFLINNVTDDNNSWGTPDMNATSAHWAAEMAWDYFLDTWDRNGPDGGGNKLRILADWHKHGNSKWEPFGNQDAIWIGWDTLDGTGIGSLDVVGHEFTHGVSESAAGLIGGGPDEQSALVESFSDIFGEVIEDYVLGTHDWIQGGETSSAIPQRDLHNPNTTSNPDTYLTGTFWDNSAFPDPHINGGVQNRWFSLLAEGDELNGVNLYDGIGFDKAAKIAYYNLNFYMQEGATFADSRSGAIFAAKSIYGVCSLEERRTTDAWAAVGVGSTYAGNCIQISGPGSVCTGVGSPQSWVANAPPGATITWSYPSYWNCTLSGSGNKILTLNSMSPQPPFSINATISASASTGGTDSHNVYMVTGCLNMPPPCPEEERSSNLTDSSQDESTNGKISIFPNPVTEKLRIVTNQIGGSYRVEVINMLGKVIAEHRVEGSNFELDTQNLAPGSYILRIIQPQAQEVHTFIKF